MTPNTLRATGIVRRLDGLGRVVIPKDVRDAKGIGTGTPLEFLTDVVEGGQVVVLRRAEPDPREAVIKAARKWHSAEQEHKEALKLHAESGPKGRLPLVVGSHQALKAAEIALGAALADLKAALDKGGVTRE